jgi:hypothetical protein
MGIVYVNEKYLLPLLVKKHQLLSASNNEIQIAYFVNAAKGM